LVLPKAAPKAGGHTPAPAADEPEHSQWIAVCHAREEKEVQTRRDRRGGMSSFAMVPAFAGAVNSALFAKVRK
jgi:hypothetical protein